MRANKQTYAVKLFDEQFGRDFDSRIKKLREECLELVEAIDNVSPSHKDGEIDHLVDEMGDVLAVITHAANILHLSIDEVLSGAVEKVERRIVEPNFKR